MLRYISFPCLRFCSPQLRCESIGFFIGTVQGISFSMGNQAEFLFLPSQALRLGRREISPVSQLADTSVKGQRYGIFLFRKNFTFG